VGREKKDRPPDGGPESWARVVNHEAWGVRHAPAELRASPDEVSLRVSDGGLVCDPTSAADGGRLGPVGRRERLRLAGSGIVSDPRWWRGTRVEARTPSGDFGGRRWPGNGPGEGASHERPAGVPLG
jgi:hypothetical protein